MQKKDVRINKTRNLIIASFFNIIERKNFNKITIADITKEAKINRSTFYYHFTDKYHLMDSIQEDVLKKEIFRELTLQKSINKQTISLALHSIISSQTDLKIYCQKSYNEFKPKMDLEIKKKLKEILLFILTTERGESENNDFLATYWSGGIYEVAMSCLDGKVAKETNINRLSALISTDMN